MLKPGGHLLAFSGPRTVHRLVCAVEDAGFEVRDLLNWVHAQGMPKGASCLKPACEPISLSRKPLDGTLKKNQAKWGTGVLHIAECRIPVDRVLDASQLRTMNRSKRAARDGWGFSTRHADKPQVVHPTGRWPGTLVHDGSLPVLAEFAKAGIRTSGLMRTGQQRKKSLGLGGYHDHRPDETTRTDTYADTGPVSRFFVACPFDESDYSRFAYFSKASRSERTERGVVKNDHPTVKPLSLMRWLVRLVTPPGGLVLDPFVGSGTTLLAAREEGMRSIGIEKDMRYYRIAAKRLRAHGGRG